MAFLSRKASSALRPRCRAETYCKLTLGYTPPFSAGGRKPSWAVVFCEDQSVLAPIAKSVCWAKDWPAHTSSAPVKTSETSLLNPPPESATFLTTTVQVHARHQRTPFRDANRSSAAVLVWTDSVSDGSSDMDKVAGSEIRVIVEDLVVANLRANEDVSPDVVADPRPQIHEEMLGALIAGAKIDAVAGRRVAVEASGLPANATHQVKTGFLAELGLVNPIDVEQDGTERLSAAAAVLPLACLPSGIEPEAEAVVQDHVAAKVHV